MPEQQVDLAIVGGTVVSCDGADPRLATVTVRDGVVVDIVDGGRTVDARRTIDASGSAVLPGFVDSHTHIASNMLLRGLLEEIHLRATLGYGFADGGVYADVADWSWAALADFDAASSGWCMKQVESGQR